MQPAENPAGVTNRKALSTKLNEYWLILINRLLITVQWPESSETKGFEDSAAEAKVTKQKFQELLVKYNVLKTYGFVHR